MKGKIKTVLPVIIICTVALIAEMLLSNFAYFAFVAGKTTVTDYTPADSTTILTEEEATFSVDGIDFPLNSVSFDIRTIGGGEKLATASFFVADENTQSGYQLVRREKIAVSENERRVTVYLNSFGNASGLYISFSDCGQAAVVSSVELNPSYKFGFNTLRFAFIFIALVFFYLLKYRGEAKRLRNNMTFGNAAILSAAFCSAAAIIVWILSSSGRESGLITYPLAGEIDYYSPYIQQFDAFQKGQLNLDVQPSAQLLALDNPYNPGSREGIHYLFDRALFGGKYYSYFGIAPILTVYYPFYLITGSLPVDSTVMLIFSLMAAIFLPLAIIEWAKQRGKGIRPWFAAVCAIGAYFASTALIIQRGVTPFYYLASAAGIAFVSAFLFFSVKAFGSKGKARLPLMAAAGISFALAFLSRLNAVIPAAITIAVVMAVYAVRSFKKKNYARFFADAVALAFPVVLAVGFSLWYNNARFGNPLQFGADYQLTVANASLYELYAGGILPSIFHYFLQPFGISEQFPYIGLSYTSLAEYGRSVYVDGNFGIFALPFTLAFLLCPIAFSKRRAETGERLIVFSAILSLFITAFADFCLGGVIFRYTSDIALFAAVLAAVALLEMSANANIEHHGDLVKFAKVGGTALACATILIVFLASFIINGNLVQCSPSIYEGFKNFFVL